MENKKMTKREKVLGVLLGLSIFLAVIAAVLFFSYNGTVKKEYVAFEEKFNTNYVVKLKDNEHFGEEQGKGEVYIANIVDDINASISYRLAYGVDDVEVAYTYNVYVLTEITSKDHKTPIYSDKEMITEVKTPIASGDVTTISANVTIDYDNKIKAVKEFNAAYGLSGTTTTIYVVMEVKSTGVYEDFANDSKLNSSVKLAIPVVDSTFVIDVSETTARDNKVLLAGENSDGSNSKTYSIVYALFAVLVFVIRIVYKKKTRNSKEIYEDKLEDILGNYESYVQKVSGELAMDGYEVVEVGSVEDLLEIKETVNKPILMIEKEDMVDFVILDKNNLSYIYKLRVEESAQ